MLGEEFTFGEVGVFQLKFFLQQCLFETFAVGYIFNADDGACSLAAFDNGTADVFRRASHIYDLQIVVRHLLFQLRDTHLLDRFDRKSRIALALHAASEIAFDVLDTDARESNYRLVNLRIGVGDHDDRGI